MTKQEQVYKCEVCGNIVEILHEGAGTLVCCNQPMTLQEEQNQDNGLEKHVPVIHKDGNTVTVKVGDVQHPMEDDHYIEWIELIVDGKVYRQHLNPTDLPEATFQIEGNSIELTAREYCSIHGLWTS